MTKPYLERKAGDFITAEDWNEMQITVREFLDRHAHTGKDGQGGKLNGDAMEQDASLSVKEIQVDDLLTVKEGALSIAGNTGIGFDAPKARLAVNGGLHVGGNDDPGDGNLIVEGSAAIGELKVEGPVSAGSISTTNLDADGTINAKAFKTTLYSVGGGKKVMLKSDNKWAEFPGLKQKFDLPYAATVIMSYHISMNSKTFIPPKRKWPAKAPGWVRKIRSGTHVTMGFPVAEGNIPITHFGFPKGADLADYHRKTIPKGSRYLYTRLTLDGKAAHPHGLSFTGNADYWSPSNTAIIHFEKGVHTISVQYRTPAGGTCNPGNMVLQVLIFGSI